SGRELLERLRRDRPELLARLVFSTGDAFTSETATLLKESGVPTVAKPFDFAVLELVVREVAGRATASASGRSRDRRRPLRWPWARASPAALRRSLAARPARRRRRADRSPPASRPGHR